MNDNVPMSVLFNIYFTAYESFELYLKLAIYIYNGLVIHVLLISWVHYIHLLAKV